MRKVNEFSLLELERLGFTLIAKRLLPKMSFLASIKLFSIPKLLNPIVKRAIQ